MRKKGKRYKKTVEKEHGGTAVREYYITEDVNRYADRKQWKKLKAFGMVHKTLIKGEKTEFELALREQHALITLNGKDFVIFIPPRYSAVSSNTKGGS